MQLQCGTSRCSVYIVYELETLKNVYVVVNNSFPMSLKPSYPRENQEPIVTAADNMRSDKPVISKHSGGDVQVACGGLYKLDVGEENPWLSRCGRRGEGADMALHDRHPNTNLEVHAVEDELGNIKRKVDQEIESHIIVSTRRLLLMVSAFATYITPCKHSK